MRTALVMTPFFPPSPWPGATHRVASFARYLPLYGWRPLVVTMDWGDPPSELGPELAVYRTRNLARLSWRTYQAGNLEHRPSAWAACCRQAVRLLRLVKDGVMIPDEKILWLPWVLPAVGRIVKEAQPDLMLASAPPFSTLVAAALAQRRHGLPLVCDFRDDWGGNPLFEKRNRLLRAIEARFERWVVHRSDRVVVPTESSARLLSQRHPGEQAKLCLVPNGYDEDDFGAVSARHIPHFSLVHAGAMEADRSPELVFRALARLGAVQRDIHFHQLGVTRREFRRLPACYGVEGVVHFEEQVSARDALAWIKGASVLVLIPTRTAPTAIPGKAYEYLRTGKPIMVLSEDNATTEFMAQFRNVFTVRPDDTERCVGVLEGLLAKPSPPPDEEALKRELGPFERRELAGRLAHVLDSVCAARGGSCRSNRRQGTER